MKAITRFELIGEGREIVLYEDMEYDIQDNGRTLKVFRIIKEEKVKLSIMQTLINNTEILKKFIDNNSDYMHQNFEIIERHQREIRDLKKRIKKMERKNVNKK